MRLSDGRRARLAWCWPMVAARGKAGAQSPSEAALNGKDWPLAAGGAA
jgi:hypothetical protein